MTKIKVLFKNTFRKKVYISLTSIDSRINKIGPVINSLLSQTSKPDKIYLYLSEEPYLLDNGIKKSEIPSNILELHRKKLIQIVYTKNIGPYRKLIPLLKKKFRENCLIVTADDDTIYPDNWLEGLLEEHKKNPDYVIAYRCRYLKLNSNNRIAPYQTWERVNYDESKVLDPKLIFPTGKGGILYSPKFFPNLVFNEFFLNVAKTNDDIWFKFMTLIKGKGVKIARSSQINDESDLEEIPENKIRLYDINSDNTSENNNDSMIKKILYFLKSKNYIIDLGDKYSNRVLIYAFSRTGSTQLLKILNSSKKIRLVNEPFNKDSWKENKTSDWNYFKLNSIESNKDLKLAITGLFRNYEGFKHIINSSRFYPNIEIDILKTPNLKVIFLLRKNLLQRALSHEISMQTGKWKEKTPIDFKFNEVKLERLEKSITDYKLETNKIRNILKNNEIDFLEVYYEDIFNQYQEDSLKKIEKIFNFLNITSTKEYLKDIIPLLENKRFNNEEIYQRIPNIYEISKRFESVENGFLA